VKRALAILLVLAATPALAGTSPQLDKAESAIDNVDYDAAKTLVDAAIAGGSLEPGDLARAHRLAGEVAAALGDDAGAKDHFIRWILLEPDAKLADGVSPKIAAPFAAARDEAQSLGSMSIDVRVERAPGKVRVFLDTRDPAHMVAGLRVRADDGLAAQEHGTSVELPAKDDASMSLTVLVLDDHDDQIAIKTITSDPEITAHAPPPAAEHRWPLLVRWPTWSVLAVAALGAGGYFVWQTGKDQNELDALNADSAHHTFDEANAIEARGKAHALDANIAFAAGGVLATAAVVVFLIEPRGKVEVAPEVGPSGAGLTALLRF
jgi:hypothetical protein